MKTARKQEAGTPTLLFKISVSNNLEINWHLGMSSSLCQRSKLEGKSLFVEDRETV